MSALGEGTIDGVAERRNTRTAYVADFFSSFAAGRTSI